MKTRKNRPEYFYARYDEEWAGIRSMMGQRM